MKGSGRHTQRFLLDTNVFVSALEARGKALELAVSFLGRKYDLIGNASLIDEYVRYSERIPSDVARFLLAQFSAKMRVVEVASRFVKICRPYFPKEETADVLFAATCLQEDAVLITNDNHFRRIRKAGIIEVWSISEAVAKLL